jgi:polar amino acid transport system substrate-binding protein
MCPFFRLPAQLCFAFVLSAVAACAQADPLQIVTTHLPPMSLEGSPAAPGAMVEVVAEMTRRAELPATIAFLPWPRAIFMAQNMKHIAIFPLTRTPEREKQFRWLVPLFQENYVFIANGGGHFDLQHPEAMKDKRVGVLRGSAMLPELRASGYRHIVETSSVDEGRRFLARGIVDAMVGDRDIVRRSIKGLPEADRFEMSKPVRKTHTWLGAPLDFSDKEAAQLEKAMNSMVEDGSYARILKKYALAPD